MMVGPRRVRGGCRGRKSWKWDAKFYLCGSCESVMGVVFRVIDWLTLISTPFFLKKIKQSVKKKKKTKTPANLLSLLYVPNIIHTPLFQPAVSTCHHHHHISISPFLSVNPTSFFSIYLLSIFCRVAHCISRPLAWWAPRRWLLRTTSLGCCNWVDSSLVVANIGIVANSAFLRLRFALIEPWFFFLEFC